MTSTDLVGENLHYNDFDSLERKKDFNTQVSYAICNDNSFTQIPCRRFTCGACGRRIIERNLQNHHKKEHSGVPFNVDMYELYEIGEHVQCNICFEEMPENLFNKHQQKFHPNEVTIDENSNGEIISRRYKCGSCGGIMDEKILEKHHKKVHSDIAFTMDMYELYEINTKIMCQVCGMKTQDNEYQEHRQKYHSNVSFEQNTTVMEYNKTGLDEEVGLEYYANQDFYNVCISNYEFQRLMQQQRIYSQNGQLFLADSF